MAKPIEQAATNEREGIAAQETYRRTISDALGEFGLTPDIRRAQQERGQMSALMFDQSSSTSILEIPGNIRDILAERGDLRPGITARITQAGFTENGTALMTTQGAGRGAINLNIEDLPPVAITYLATLPSLLTPHFEKYAVIRSNGR